MRALHCLRGQRRVDIKRAVALSALARNVVVTFDARLAMVGKHFISLSLGDDNRLLAIRRTYRKVAQNFKCKKLYRFLLSTPTFVSSALTQDKWKELKRLRFVPVTYVGARIEPT